MVTELPEDVLAFVRRFAGYGNAYAQDLLAKYEPPKWQQGDVVRDRYCVSVRRADGQWLCSATDWNPAHSDRDIVALGATLIARDGKAVSA